MDRIAAYFMAAKSEKQDRLPLNSIELGGTHISYQVPASLPEEKRFGEISPEYLRWRVESAIKLLRDRITIHTAVHFRKNQADLLARVDGLRKEILDCIEKVVGGGIRSKWDREKFCRALHPIIHGYTTERTDPDLKIRGILANRLLRVEGGALDSISALPESVDESGAISISVEDIEKLKLELQEILGVEAKFPVVEDIKKNWRKTKDRADEIIGEAKKALAMCELFPTAEKVKAMPEAVAQSINETTANLSRDLEKIAETTLQLLDFLEELREIDVARTKNGVTFAKNLAAYRPGSPIAKAVSGLGCLSADRDFDTFNQKVERMRKSMEEMVPDLEALWNDLEVQRLAELLLNGSKSGALSQLLTMYQNGQSTEAQPKPGSAPGARMPEGVEQTATRSIDWKNGSIEDVIKVGRAKLMLFCPLIAELEALERFDDLQYVLDNITTTELREMGFSNECLTAQKGKKTVTGRFGTRDGLFGTLFEKFREPRFTTPVRERMFKKEEKATPFSWSSADVETRQSKVRERMSQAWPLLQELYEARRYQEFRFLVDHINRSDFVHFGIHNSCLSEKGVYKTVEQMIDEVFPESVPFKMAIENAEEIAHGDEEVS